MNCDEMRPMIGDWLEGELSASDVERVESHLSECADCRAERDETAALLASAGELEREIAPKRDLWEGIESRIAETGEVVRGPWWSQSWVGWAAAAVLVLALGVQLNRDRAATVSPGSVAQSSAVTMSAPNSIELIAQTSDAARSRDGLMQVREDLLRSITERRDSLDPEAQRQVDENLLIIDQAITSIYQALQDNPQNRELEFLLASTYQREVNFLKQMNLL
jgi:hypothetical protein